MRSFTLPSGLKNSPFNAIVATAPLTIRFSLISGVRPTVLITSGYTGIITFLSLMGLVLQIRRVGDELAILRQDHAQRRYQGSFLQISRRRLRRFQDDLKGPRAHLGRRAQRPRVSVAYDAVARAKAVNGLTRIARQELLRRLQRRLDQVLGQRRPACKPIEALAAVVGMQRDDPVESVRHQFRLQQLHLRLLRPVPELAVQILPAARRTRAIFEPRRVADRIHKQAITGGQLWFALQHAKELDKRVNSLGFVTVKAD